MKEHKHNTLEDDRKSGKIVFSVTSILTAISMVLLVYEIFDFGLGLLAVAFFTGFLTLAMLIKIQARYTRIMIADLNNISEYAWCKICFPEGVKKPSGNSS